MGSIRDKDRDMLRRTCRLVLGGKARDMLDMGLRREDNRGMHKRDKGILLRNHRDMLPGKDRDTLLLVKGTHLGKDKDTHLGKDKDTHLGKDKAMCLPRHCHIPLARAQLVPPHGAGLLRVEVGVRRSRVLFPSWRRRGTDSRRLTRCITAATATGPGVLLVYKSRGRGFCRYLMPGRLLLQ